MKKNNLSSLISHSLVLWFLILGTAAVTLFFVVAGYISFLWLSIHLVLIALAYYDSFVQKTHTLRTNFPIIARFRYLLEAFRPALRQYFFEGELDGKPFNRRQRSIVYQRSKNVKQTISFGMQDDPDRIGYEWAAHSIYTKKPVVDDFRVMVGNEACTQPYSLSVLNVSAMSYGALSKTAIRSLNQGAMKGNFAHNTGEGGISEYHLMGGDLIWQIGTGYFGCRNDEGNFDPYLFAEKSKIPNVKMIEVKISQGAKPGHGGLLPAEKNTPEIAKIRHIEPYKDVHSPSSHSAFSDATGLLQFIKQLRELSGGKPIGFKICIGRRTEFLDIVEAMNQTGIVPDFITVDGAEGGTGAAPLEFIDSVGMSLIDSLAFVSHELNKHGLRDRVTIIASGKVITAFDIYRALALGANACYSARGMMFSLGCIQSLLCDNGSCPVGIATQDQKLYKGIDVTQKSERVANYHRNTMKALAEFTGACGAEKLSEINPEFFYRRTGYNENTSYKELFFTDK